MKKRLLMCLAGLLGLIGLIVVLSQIWPAKKGGPQILFKEEDSVPGQRMVYTVSDETVGGEVIFLPETDAARAQSVVDAQILGVQSSFENRLVPYGGQITSSFDCEARKYIKEENVPFAGIETKLVLAVASERRVFGVCSAGQIRYAAAFWAAYDGKKGRVINISLFRQVAGPEEIEASQQELLRTFRGVLASEKF